MFDIEQFVADCRAARAADETPKAVRAVVARAVTDPGAIVRAVGEPTRGGARVLYRGPDLTVIDLTWAPRMCVMPHNHNMWAVIGVYAGREDNVYWRRRPDDAARVSAAGAESLGVGDVATLGKDIIHSVLNPIPRLSTAIHVYGGDFFAKSRSEWDAETLVERPGDPRQANRLFEEANALYGLH